MAVRVKTTAATKAALKWAAQAPVPEGYRLYVEPAPEIELDGSSEALERQDALTHTRTGMASYTTEFPLRITLERIQDLVEAVGRSAVVASRDGAIKCPDGLMSDPGVGVYAAPRGVDLRDKTLGLEFIRVESPAALREWLDAWLAEEVASL